MYNIILYILVFRDIFFLFIEYLLTPNFLRIVFHVSFMISHYPLGYNGNSNMLTHGRLSGIQLEENLQAPLPCKS